MSEPVSDKELLDWIDLNNISVNASSQRGYKRWQIVELDHSSESRLLADLNCDLRKALMYAYHIHHGGELRIEGGVWKILGNDGAVVLWSDQ